MSAHSPDYGDPLKPGLKPLSSCIMFVLLLGLESPLSPKPGPLVLSTLILCPMPSLLFYCVFWDFYHPPSLLLFGFHDGGRLVQSHF